MFEIPLECAAGVYLLNSRERISSWHSHWLSNILSSWGRSVGNVPADFRLDINKSIDKLNQFCMSRTQVS